MTTHDLGFSLSTGDIMKANGNILIKFGKIHTEVFRDTGHHSCNFQIKEREREKE